MPFYFEDKMSVDLSVCQKVGFQDQVGYIYRGNWIYWNVGLWTG